MIRNESKWIAITWIKRKCIEIIWNDLKWFETGKKWIKMSFAIENPLIYNILGYRWRVSDVIINALSNCINCTVIFDGIRWTGAQFVFDESCCPISQYIVCSIMSVLCTDITHRLQMAPNEIDLNVCGFHSVEEHARPPICAKERAETFRLGAFHHKCRMKDGVCLTEQLEKWSKLNYCIWHQSFVIRPPIPTMEIETNRWRCSRAFETANPNCKQQDYYIHCVDGLSSSSSLAREQFAGPGRMYIDIRMKIKQRVRTL